MLQRSPRSSRVLLGEGLYQRMVDPHAMGIARDTSRVPLQTYSTANEANALASYFLMSVKTTVLQPALISASRPPEYNPSSRAGHLMSFMARSSSIVVHSRTERMIVCHLQLMSLSPSGTPQPEWTGTRDSPYQAPPAASGRCSRRETADPLFDSAHRG